MRPVARFGVHGSVLGVIATSNGATVSYNTMRDSLTPLGTMVPMVNSCSGIVYRPRDRHPQAG